ncbi:ATP-binding protein [Streptacidiphilus melanogenes]|uniref:ATP-binding protein n=1 Tax=Streptacidiphilus melanogenes TaxID=411235 RepID=UPI000694011B|nr:ATP-binding protein [Streptacidiphilus melanogenes]
MNGSWTEDGQDARRRARLTLRDSAAPASAARRFSRLTLGSWGLWSEAEEPAGVTDIVLVVSELVTNAARHGGGVQWVALSSPCGDTIRVEVADLSRRLPAVQRPQAPARPGGHGLRLILHAADRFGVRLWRHRPGKSVWAEFHRVLPHGGAVPSDGSTAGEHRTPDHHRTVTAALHHPNG